MTDAVSQIISKNISLRDSDFIKILFGDCYDKFVEQGQSVIIYGAGSAGKELSKLLELHEVHTLYFCDKNDDLIGRKIFGKEIISPQRLSIEFNNIFVIVGIQNNKEEAVNFLRKFGISNIRSINNAEQFFYYLQFPKWSIPLVTIKNDSELINDAFNLLCDDKSRHIYINRLAILSSFADYSSYKTNCSLTDYPAELPIDKRIFSWYFENQMYFNNDLINLSDDFCLVDCGAYTGDSYIEFHKAMKAKNLICGKSYCFEPDARNYSSLKANLIEYNNVSLFNIGCYDAKKTLEFANSDLMHVTEAFIVENNKDKVIYVAEGNDFVEVDTIDNLVFPNRVDVIKMDVEGSEAKALKGAENTIKMHHPVLIISAYHKISDLYNLTLLIRDISPVYKIYLRQFSFSWSETVLIAKI